MAEERKLTAEEYLINYNILRKEKGEETARREVLRTMIQDEELMKRAVDSTAHVFDKYTKVISKEAAQGEEYASDRVRQDIFMFNSVAFHETLALLAAEDYASDSIIREGQVVKLDAGKRLDAQSKKTAEEMKSRLKGNFQKYSDSIGTYVENDLRNKAELVKSTVGTDVGDTRFSRQVENYMGTKERPGQGLLLDELAEETQKTATKYSQVGKAATTA